MKISHIDDDDKYINIAPGTDLREHEALKVGFNLKTLPKAIGGDAVTVDEEGKEDERCLRGVKHPTWNDFLTKLQV